MKWQQALQLDESLHTLTHYFSIPFVQAEPLANGLTNQCWKVITSNGSAYVWRPCSEVSRAFSISRWQEHQILQHVAKSISPTTSPFAPNSIAYFATGVLVEWVEGESPSKNVDDETLINLLVKVHATDIDSREFQALAIEPFDYTKRLEHYWSQIASEYKNSEFERLYQLWKQPPELTHQVRALCHFDMGHYNLVESRDGVSIIDWEYAAVADPCLDLAMTISVANADTGQFVEKYCKARGIKEVKRWLEAVEAWLPRCSILAMAWYLLAYKHKRETHYLESANQIKRTFCS